MSGFGSNGPRPAASPRTILFRVVAVLVVLLGLMTLSGGLYVVDAGEQAVVLQFQRAVGAPVTEPGLHFKVPFLQDVVRFDKRILSWDGDPEQITTRGREFISVDTTARWRIVEPLKFLQSVRDEIGARSRLDDVLDSVVKDTISSTELVEIVRSSNWTVAPEDLEREVVGADGQTELSRKIVVGREGLERAILAEAQKSMPNYGIGPWINVHTSPSPQNTTTAPGPVGTNSKFAVTHITDGSSNTAMASEIFRSPGMTFAG